MKSLFTAALLLILVPAFSCIKDSTSNANKWSVGIILMNQAYSPGFGFQTNILPGFTVRRDLGKFRLRSAAEISLHNTNSEIMGYPDESYYKEKTFSSLLRIGIEKGWTIKKIFRPYVGLDLAGGYNKIARTDYGGLMGLYSDRVNKLHIAGILPTAGLECFIHNRFSVTAETQMSFLFVKEYQKVTYYTGNVDTRPTSYTYFDFNLYRPLAVGIHYHF